MHRIAATSAPHKALSVLATCRLQHSGLEESIPKLIKATATSYSEGPTTLVEHEPYKFIIDEPQKLGGQGLGANPLDHLLGSLASSTSYTMAMISNEMKIPLFKRAAWKVSGEYDLRGLQGVGGIDARLQKITLAGVIDTDSSQKTLDQMIPKIESRSIMAATLKASGMELALRLEKGDVKHDCDSACELHALENENVAGKEDDQEDDSRGQKLDSSVSFGRQYHTRSFTCHPDGEDVARSHLQAEQTPQLQKETSEKGAEETAGGAYASRDSPRAQAAQPTEGKSDEQLVQEQTANATTRPDESIHKDAEVTKSPEYADRALDASRHGNSPLGQQPSGTE